MNRPHTIPYIGLTGGIGSGKSTVAKALAELGAFVIDADQISHQLTAPKGAAIPAIRRAFGDDYVTAEGAMARDTMRTRISNDVHAKHTLEAILHPMIYEQAQRQAHLPKPAHVRCVVFEVPLLIESGRWRDQLDHILVIDCDPEVQIARVMPRNHLTREQVQAMMAMQAPRALRLRAGDTIIDNTHLTLAALRERLSLFLDFIAPIEKTRPSGLAECGG